MSFPYVSQAGEHEQLEWLGEGIMEVLLDGQRTGGALSMFRSTLPSATASPVHVHSTEDEIILMLSGSGLFWIGDRRFEVTAGGIVYLPRNIPHAYHVTSDQADMLAIATPSGVENFFRDAGWSLSRPKPADWAVTPEILEKAAAENGQILLGPPLGSDEMIPTAVIERFGRGH
ncbi:cupin domain-containing protein [Streptomyces griseorubiginosus]|uniref:Cupin domain-containing protein n=1 Tax=Streptomyces longisporus TaxID=1948 RepID=A0ABN3N7Z8_STRLO